MSSFQFVKRPIQAFPDTKMRPKRLIFGLRREQDPYKFLRYQDETDTFQNRSRNWDFETEITSLANSTNCVVGCCKLLSSLAVHKLTEQLKLGDETDQLPDNLKPADCSLWQTSLHGHVSRHAATV